MSTTTGELKGKAGRKEGGHIKDVVYEKWFGIYFRYKLLTYIYCKPDGVRYTFIPLETTRSFEVPNLNIVKCLTKEEAEYIIKTIPEFEILNEPIYPEAIENTMLPELL